MMEGQDNSASRHDVSSHEDEQGVATAREASEVSEASEASPKGGEASLSEKPDYLPEKFWDKHKGVPRLSALAKSYGELERLHGAMVRIPHKDMTEEERRHCYQKLGVPASPEDYTITLNGEAFESDPAINARLHEAGLTQEQAQLVYSLAQETLVPLVEWAAGEMRSDHEEKTLIEAFGGEQTWQTTAKQIAAWGEKNVPPDIYDVLARSAKGVMALHAMMNNKEPTLDMGTSHAHAPTSERELRRMVESTAYWRDRDPETLRKVEEGFAQLFGRGNI